MIIAKDSAVVARSLSPGYCSDFLPAVVPPPSPPEFSQFLDQMVDTDDGVIAKDGEFQEDKNACRYVTSYFVLFALSTAHPPAGAIQHPPFLRWGDEGRGSYKGGFYKGTGHCCDVKHAASGMRI